MAKKTFKARLIRPEGVGTWTYLTVPFNAAEEYGSQAQVRVKGTINGLSYRSTLLPQGDGTHYLVVNRTIRDQIGVTHGDTVQVMMERDIQPRTVSIPRDFKLALERNKKAKTEFDRIPYSHKKRYLEHIVEAKQEETRKWRIQEAIARLGENARAKR